METEHAPTVCILAGGRGARLGNAVENIPKPLLEVAGRPFLLHQLELLAAHGIREVVLCVGYLGDRIEDRIGRRQFGIDIGYSYDSPHLDGTLGAIRKAAARLPDKFLVLYGDTYLRVDYLDVFATWCATRRLATMTVLRNDGRWEVSNVVFAAGVVLRYDKLNPSPALKWVDFGLGGLDQRALELVGSEESDLAQLYARLAELGELSGYEVTERFYEIGTPGALAETEAFLKSLD